MKESQKLTAGMWMDCICKYESFSVDIVYIPPGSIKEPIVHHECDEFLYVLDGELDIIVNSLTIHVRKDEYVEVPSVSLLQKHQN